MSGGKWQVAGRRRELHDSDGFSEPISPYCGHIYDSHKAWRGPEGALKRAEPSSKWLQARCVVRYVVQGLDSTGTQITGRTVHLTRESAEDEFHSKHLAYRTVMMKEVVRPDETSCYLCTEKFDRRAAGSTRRASSW